MNEQIRELPYYNSFFKTANPPAVELARLVTSLAPDHINHVFFTGSGSESNDTVVRMVRHYWSSMGQPSRKVIISRHNAYHGSTVAAASLGGMKPMHAQGGLPIPDIEHINQPYWYENGGDLSQEEFGIQVADELEAKILEVGAHRVAAFIGEPIQALVASLFHHLPTGLASRRYVKNTTSCSWLMRSFAGLEEPESGLGVTILISPQILWSLQKASARVTYRLVAYSSETGLPRA